MSLKREHQGHIPITLGTLLSATAAFDEVIFNGLAGVVRVV